MIRFLTTFSLFIFITNCSFDEHSGFWTKDKKVEREKQKIIKILFEDERVLENEFNPGLKINLKAHAKAKKLQHKHELVLLLYFGSYM